MALQTAQHFGARKVIAVGRGKAETFGHRCEDRYSTPLLDILPMYIVLILASPLLLLLHGLHRGWLGMMAASVALWAAAQFGLSHRLYDGVVALTGWQLIPYRQLSAFELLAWQFLWVLGLWMGSTRTADRDAPGHAFPGLDGGHRDRDRRGGPDLAPRGGPSGPQENLCLVMFGARSSRCDVKLTCESRGGTLARRAALPLAA